MEKILNRFKKVLLDRTSANVNDFEFKFFQEASSPEYLRAKARSRFTSEEHDLKVEKFNLTQYGKFVNLAISERVVYNINALHLINRQYDLNLIESDVEPVRVTGDTFEIEAKTSSPFYTGKLTVSIVTPALDIIAFLDNQTKISYKEPSVLTARYLLRHLNFTYMYDDLIDVKVGSGLDKKLLEKMTCRATNFKVLDVPAEYNLRGAVVVSNEPVKSSFTIATHVLKLGLNKKLCTGCSGILEIYY